MSFLKKHWLWLAAGAVCIVQPELFPVVGVALVGKFVAKYLK